MKQVIQNACEYKGSLSTLTLSHCEFATFTPLLLFSHRCARVCVCAQTCVSLDSPYMEWLLGRVDVVGGLVGGLGGGFEQSCSSV